MADTSSAKYSLSEYDSVSLIVAARAPPPKNSFIRYYKSKLFWFGFCHCVFFLILVIIALIVFNNFGFSPLILHLFSLKEGDKPLLGKGESCLPDYTHFPETKSCYKISSTGTLFEDAQAACQADGAHLASVHSENENIFIAGLFHLETIRQLRSSENPRRLKHPAWIGLTRENGSWSWLDGSPVTYRNWNSQEDALDVTKRWAVIGSTGTSWHKISGMKRGYVCKMPTASSEESTLRSRLETSPCPAEYTWFESTGFCYKVTTEKADYESSKKGCGSVFAALVSVKSNIEEIFVRGLIEQALEKNDLKEFDFWIGLTYQSGNHTWSDGSPADYTAWDPTEPNHATGFDYTEMPYWSGWKSSKDTEKGYICKI